MNIESSLRLQQYLLRVRAEKPRLHVHGDLLGNSLVDGLLHLP